MPAHPPVPVRAHNLLCLLGYRGRGYDAAFVERMTGLHRRLRTDPETEVLVRASPDVLCEACPHLGGSGCTLAGPGHEAHMRAQDAAVLLRLGLADGGVYRWREVLERVAERLQGRDLTALCTTCPWLGLGWCAEGIERVRAGQPPVPPDLAP